MTKKRKAAKILRRKPRSWLGMCCILLSLGSLAFKVYDQDAAGRLTNPSQIFESFADLNVDAAMVARMHNSPLPPRGKPLAARWRRVAKVLDGDTLKLDTGETVRLIGVDAPESSANRKLRDDIYKMGFSVNESDMIRLGESATAFTGRLAEGRPCWLEHEREAYDQYGRLLAYVHLQDGRILNEEIIANGYGKTYLGYSFKYKKRYILLQAEASFKKRGLWGGI